MTDKTLREAAEKALEALDLASLHLRLPQARTVCEAYAALRAALASSPEQAEPVAPVGFLPAYELNRLQSGHDARLRSARFGPSELDGDVPVYLTATQPAAPVGRVRGAAEVAPRPLDYSVTDYHIAPGGDGPLAATWKDKPHRLVYDLIAAVKFYATAPTAPAPATEAAQGMAEVCQEDANNYSLILTALGMEEEGDPVAEVKRLIAQVDDLREAAFKAEHEAPPLPQGEKAISIERLSTMFQSLDGVDKHAWGYSWRQGWNDALRLAMDYAAPPPPAAPVGQAWQLERMRHIANEWADMATNGTQWLRNIKDGTSTVDDALANMEVCYQHCRKVNDAPGLYGADTAPPAPAPTQEDANNYSLILTALGMEEEGDPVAEVKRLIDKLTGALSDDDSETQRVEVCNAWNDLPSGLKAHPGLKRLYRALGGGTHRPDGEAGEIGGAA